MTFRDRVSVITGAGGGIGRAVALELASRGSHLALNDVDEAGLAETVRRAEALGRRVTSKVFDVSDREAFTAFAEETLEVHGRVDAVLNNAGVTVQNTLQDTSWKDWEWIVGINFWGVLHGTKIFLPHLLERGDGWIVNISSIFGIISVPTQSAYNATKFAVRGMTEALRQEVVGTGVTVTCVHPGGIKTNIVKNARFYTNVDGQGDHGSAIRDFERIARTSPEEAARVIVEGMERKAPRVLIGRDARWVDRVQRTMPVRYTKLLATLSERLRR